MANKKRQTEVTPEMLIKVRKAAKLSQEEAAKLIGKSRRSYVYYENGVIFAKKEYYEKILAEVKNGE